MDLVQLHHRAADVFGARVHAVKRDQWALSTPCEDWNVRDLVNHLVYEDRWTAPILAGKTIEEIGDRFEGDLLGDDPGAAWEDAVAEARAAVAEPHALERTGHRSFGDSPAELYVHQLFADHLIHAWDLARAIGADERLDADLVRACAAWFADQEEDYRSAGAIGDRPAIPDDADEQTRLLAAFGRTP